MQAQDFAGAEWAIGLRLPGTTLDSVETAFNQGRILRTHVLRPTWHFVTPDDIRWMLDLTAPRVMASTRSIFVRRQLDDATIALAESAFRTALVGGNNGTRAELSDALRRDGLTVGLVELGLLLMRAELDGLICSGSLRGKQQTYALLEERAPNAVTLTRDEALMELTRRYFISHGPATVKDFAWWSSLTTRDIRRSIGELGSELERISIDGVDHWFAPSQSRSSDGQGTVHLLPNYDEYVVGFSNRDAYWHPSIDRMDVPRGNPLFNNTIVQDGKIVGTWTRTIKRDLVTLSASPLEPFDDDAAAELRASIARYGHFLELPIQAR
jgi:hypothetical protein